MTQRDTDEFFDGEYVHAIYFPPAQDGAESYTVGRGGVEKITVVMEKGQMAKVPWFAIWERGKITSKHNGALIESVLYKQEYN